MLLQSLIPLLHKMVALIALFLPVVVCVEEDTSEERKFDFTNYDEDFARNVMFPISAAAYSSTPHECLRNLFGNITHLYQYSHTCQDGKCSGFVAQLPKYKAIVIGFRGTQTVGQLYQQAIDSLLKPWSKWDYGGHISLYFHRTFQLIWDGLDIGVYLYMHQHPHWDVWISGHSLGGALATLASFFLVHQKIVEPDKLKLITFGEPRIGDKKFAEAFDDMDIYDYRVVHWRDPVPSIPSKGYWHQGQEVFYESGMDAGKSSLCVQSESDHCSKAYVPASISDHQIYFGKLVSEYGKSGCRT